MKCSGCQADLDANSKFCPSCGNAVELESAAAEPEKNEEFSLGQSVLSLAIGLAVFGWFSGWFSSDDAGSEGVARQPVQSSMAASAPSTKTIQQWAQTIERGIAPDDLIAQIGRPDSTQETGAELSGMKRWLIFDYGSRVLNQHTGKTETLRVGFSWGAATMIAEGYGGKEIELPL